MRADAEKKKQEDLAAAEKKKQEDQLAFKMKLEKMEARLLAVRPVQADVVTLNVGGVVMCTSIGTLRSVPNSGLAHLFSDEMFPANLRSTEVFIDRSPKPFGAILDALRGFVFPTSHLPYSYQASHRLSALAS